MDPHLGGHALLDGLGASPADRRKAYRELFRTAPDADFADALRVATNGGWALGDARFKRQIAKALDRQGAQPPGCAVAEGPTAEAEAGSTALKPTLTPFIFRTIQTLAACILFPICSWWGCCLEATRGMRPCRFKAEYRSDWREAGWQAESEVVWIQSGPSLMDIFFFQLVIIFIPGIIWERFDASYGPNKATQQWDILRRTFVFGLSAYVVTFCVYWFASLYFTGLNFQVFHFKKDEEFLDGAAITLIFWASVVSVICALVSLYANNYKLLTQFLQRIKATKRYGDEDVWDLTFNSGRAEVEYVHVRDFDKKITYAGWVEAFSETEKLRELRLRDVIVYDFEGANLYETPRVYLARKMDNIDIEFPYRSGLQNDESTTPPG
jgi:hypothetical protein